MSESIEGDGDLMDDWETYNNMWFTDANMDCDEIEERESNPQPQHCERCALPNHGVNPNCAEKRGRVMGSIGLLGLLLKIVFGCFVTLIVVMTLGVAAVAVKKGWDNTHDHER